MPPSSERCPSFGYLVRVRNAARRSRNKPGTVIPTITTNTSGTTISRAAFFAAVEVGSLVKAKGERNGATVTWSELELEN